MQPIFTIHAGEYLVGNLIEKKFGQLVNVWIPSKDTGIDLLLTDKVTNTKTVSIQVKFSKDYLPTNAKPEDQVKLLACGWWVLNRPKLEDPKSRADFWIFALHGFREKEIQPVILSSERLLKIYDKLERNSNTIQSYI